MSDVAGVGLTDGFLTIVERGVDGAHLSSVGLDPRGEAALSATNTGTGPGRTPTGSDEPLDTITVAPDPITLDTDGPDQPFTAIGRDASGGYKPTTPVWSRNPPAGGPTRRLEETTISPADLHSWNGDGFAVTLPWSSAYAYDHTFTADEREYVYISLALSHTAYAGSVYCVVNLNDGSIVTSADSGDIVFTVSPYTTAAGAGWRVRFSIGADAGSTVEATWNSTPGCTLTAGLSLLAGGTLPGDFIYVGTTGYGIIIDETAIVDGSDGSFSNTAFSETASTDATIDAATGVLTPGASAEVFDVVATSGAITGSATVTIS